MPLVPETASKTLAISQVLGALLPNEETLAELLVALDEGLSPETTMITGLEL